MGGNRLRLSANARNFRFDFSPLGFAGLASEQKAAQEVSSVRRCWWRGLPWSEVDATYRGPSRSVMTARPADRILTRRLQPQIARRAELSIEDFGEDGFTKTANALHEYYNTSPS